MAKCEPRRLRCVRVRLTKFSEQAICSPPPVPFAFFVPTHTPGCTLVTFDRSSEQFAVIRWQIESVTGERRLCFGLREYP
jgi:hypothetical protein